MPLPVYCIASPSSRYVDNCRLRTRGRIKSTPRPRGKSPLPDQKWGDAVYAFSQTPFPITTDTMSFKYDIRRHPPQNNTVVT